MGHLPPAGQVRRQPDGVPVQPLPVQPGGTEQTPKLQLFMHIGNPKTPICWHTSPLEQVRLVQSLPMVVPLKPVRLHVSRLQLQSSWPPRPGSHSSPATVSSLLLPHAFTQALFSQIWPVPQCDVAVHATHVLMELQTCPVGQRESRVPAEIAVTTHCPALQRAVRHSGALQCVSLTQFAQVPAPSQ